MRVGAVPVAPLVAWRRLVTAVTGLTLDMTGTCSQTHYFTRNLAQPHELRGVVSERGDIEHGFHSGFAGCLECRQSTIRTWHCRFFTDTCFAFEIRGDRMPTWWVAGRELLSRGMTLRARLCGTRGVRGTALALCWWRPAKLL